MKLFCLMLTIAVLFSGCAFAEDSGSDAPESMLSGSVSRKTGHI